MGRWQGQKPWDTASGVGYGHPEAGIQQSVQKSREAPAGHTGTHRAGRPSERGSEQSCVSSTFRDVCSPFP